MYQNANDYESAAGVLQEMLQLGGLSGNQEAKAKYMLGICNNKEQKQDTATNYMNEVQTSFAGSMWAQKAAKALETWSTDGPQAEITD